MEPSLPESTNKSSSCSEVCSFSTGLELANLRGVRWRVCLGILPSFPDASIEDFRRAAADSRRKYASLRRRLLVDPHLPKDGRTSPDLVMDNPLSQNPESMWGRFFRNAELEKMLDQDLSRLYPEHGGYFQTSGCQAMLRSILLIWCLRHSEYGYRQGMHELLAPLLYVLHVDIQRLSEVRKTYEDHFTDEFDGTSFSESDIVSNYRFTKKADFHDSADMEKPTKTSSSLDDLDAETRNIIMLSDAYGAEGELGILLSKRFMEHDAYCLFDALMNGSHGVVAMAEFFSSSKVVSRMCVPPVIDACSAVYYLLSAIDSPLHSHLVELGVEPQYFGLRWLRVLFGREFSLPDLLIIWDEVFSCRNHNAYLEIDNDLHPNFKILYSSRGSFISAMAVSMILHIRLSLLATENATSCLQKLLKFPENIDVKKLIAKARTFQPDVPPRTDFSRDRNKSCIARAHSLSFGSASSPKTPVHSVPTSYWEEKWRVLHKTEELQKETQSDKVSNSVTNGPNRGKTIFSTTESAPVPSNIDSKKDPQTSVRRRLFDDFSQEKEESDSKLNNVRDCDIVALPAVKFEVDEDHLRGSSPQGVLDNNFDRDPADTRLVTESSFESSVQSSPRSLDHQDSESEKSSFTSNSCAGDDDEGPASSETSSTYRESTNVTPSIREVEPKLEEKREIVTSKGTVVTEKNPTSGKFQWFWKFGKGSEGGNGDSQSSSGSGDSRNDNKGVSVSDDCGNKNATCTLRNMGQSMLENIQVIESALEQDQTLGVGSSESLSKNIFRGNGQRTALAALKELRKISNLLSEM